MPVSVRRGPRPKSTDKVSKKAASKKAEPKKKNPSAIQVVRSFMEEQSHVNRAILEQLAALKDKCGFVSPCFNGGEVSGARPRGSTGKGNDRKTNEPVLETSESEESDVDSDMEAKIQSDMNEAQACLQPKFVKNPGRQNSIKKIEQNVTQNRPYAFLDREKQRDLTRQNA